MTTQAVFAWVGNLSPPSISEYIHAGPLFAALPVDRVAALHRCKRESAALRQSATAESASRVLLPSMPVAMPNIKDQTVQSFLSCQMTVIVPDLANQLYFIFIIDWACTICAANSPFRKPAWFSTCTLRRLAF